MATIGTINLRMTANPSAFKKGVASAASSVDGLSSKVLSASNVIKGAFAAAVAGAGALSLGKMIQASSDLTENVGKLQAIFGPQSKAVEGDARRMADAFGVSLNTMLDGAGKLGGLFKGAGFDGKATSDLSQQFNQLTLDASRFFNVPYDTAFQKIRSGLAGEAEPLRDFGIFLTADKIKAQALAMGLGDLNGELSDQAKITASAKLIMDGLKDAQGNAAATATGTAAKIEEFRGRVENLVATLGDSLAPIAGQVLGELSVGIAAISEAWKTSGVAAVQWASDTVQGASVAGDGIGGVQSSIGFLADAWQVVSHEFHLAQGVIQEAFTYIVVGAAKAATAFDAIQKAITGVSSGIGEQVTVMADSMKASLAEAQKAFDAEAKAPWASKVIADRLAKAREEIKALQSGAGASGIGIATAGAAAAGSNAAKAVTEAKEAAKTKAENPYGKANLAGSTDAVSTILRTRLGSTGKDGVAANTKKSADMLAQLVGVQKKAYKRLDDLILNKTEFIPL